MFYRGDAKRQLHREIELMKGIHHLQPVVVIDEAHLLDKEMFEEVRFLLNFRMDAESPMALILVGQSELWERLVLQAYAAIHQRIDLQCKLHHYDHTESAAYIERHMAYAGAERDIFTEGALDEIFRFSAGSARLINKIRTHCLIYGAQNKHRIIDDHMAKRVVAGELS
jgi:type II secretory pathway predicted ATPase ExeA